MPETNDASDDGERQNQAAGQPCPGCGNIFVCDRAQGCDDCWCLKLPAILPVRSDAKCMCENCLRRVLDKGLSR